MHSAVVIISIIAGCIVYIMAGAWWRGYDAAIDNDKNLAPVIQLSDSIYWCVGAIWPVVMLYVLIRMFIRSIRLYPIIMSGYNVGTKHRNKINFRVEERQRIATQADAIEDSLNREKTEAEREVELSLGYGSRTHS